MHLTSLSPLLLRYVLQVFCNPEDVTTGMWPRHMEVQPISSAVNFERFVIDHFSLYKSMSGCILLTLSLVLTRGIEAVASDMDDSGNGLIGNFGHCNQELVNLLLSGRAVSNVFDGTRPMGDSGLVLKGIHERNDVGYLTHLESMRFCQVGSFYKVPKYPVWVVGSSSHFTVLFSLHEQVNAETEDEMLLTRVKREFRQADYEENGYIPVQRLSGVLISLGINVENMSIEAFNGLKLLLDPESCGIILFGVFWSVVSQLMSGETIDHLLEKFSSRNIITDSTAMITDEISAHQQRERSDSEMARALQDEWNYSSPGSHANIVPASSPRPQASIQHSDSDLARALQDEWNSGSSIEPPHPHHTPVFSSTPVGGLDIMSIISAVSTPPVASVPVASQPHVSLALPSSASKQQDW